MFAFSGKRGSGRRLRMIAIAASSALAGLLATATMVQADTLGTIDFETFTIGDIDGQGGWVKTGPYDVETVDPGGFPAAVGYDLGTRALRASNSVTGDSFGDQTFSPGVANEAGEASAVSGGFSTGPRQTRYEAGFEIGSTQAAEQPGLAFNVSPDRGDGSRMSFLRFEDQADGLHVIFFDVSNPGPIGTVSSFNATDIATVSRTQKHTAQFVMDFVDGPGNDLVRILIDGSLTHTGTSWEDYYRFDPEQAGSGNAVPTTDNLLFRASGPAVPANAGNGYLFDDVELSTSTPTTPTPIPDIGTVPTGAAGDVGGAVGGSKKCKKKKQGKKGAGSAAKKCKKKKKK
jgi:hypothetical protein